MGKMPTDSWWKLITPKEIIAGINQLKGRNILILDLVSSDMIINKCLSCTNSFFSERIIGSDTYIKRHPKILFIFVLSIKNSSVVFKLACPDFIDIKF